MSAPQITQKISAKSVDWRRVDIRVAATQTPPPRTYIVGHLPEQRGIYGMLIGPDGSRKSWMALHLAIAVASGRPVAGGLWPAPARGRVVFFTGEDVSREIWNRVYSIAQNEDDPTWLAECDKNLDIIPLADGADGLTLICPSDEKAGYAQHPNVAALIEYCKGARLIIIDPLSDMIDASENDDVAARLLVQVLRSISRETGAGVIVVHHQNKAAMLDGGKSNQTARGSSKVPCGARWSVTLQPLSDKEAKERDVFDQEFWTKIYEGKTSYRPPVRGGELALYHYPQTTDPHGKTVGGVPLARILPVKEETEAKPRRGLANIMGPGAKEFDKRLKKAKGAASDTASDIDARFADAPPIDPTSVPTDTREIDDDNW